MDDKVKRVYEAIKGFPELGSYLMVGGNAIALHSDYRISRDLDFATVERSLNRRLIKKLMDQLSQQFTVVLMPNIDKRQEFENNGLDLDDYQQDWLIDGVKVTFFPIGENNAEREFLAKQASTRDEAVNVMSMEGLFVTKCLALAGRIKSRDIFDLWWFVKHGGHDVSEIFSTVQQFRPHITYEQLRYRLLDWEIPKTDEGLDAKINVTIDQVRNDLRAEVDKMEISLAQKALAGKATYKPR